MTSGDVHLLEAPDFAEPFVAWRAWAVIPQKGSYRLASVVKPTIWPPRRRLVAECRADESLVHWFRRRYGHCHAAPDPGCSCGIYAGWLPFIRRYLTEGIPVGRVARALGEVALWGTVIECERGFRASLAYPSRIYLPAETALPRRHRWQDVAGALGEYGVPVELLPASDLDAIELIEQRQLAAMSAGA